MTARLKAEAVVKRFGGVTALDGVSLEVSQGAVLGLIGPNGSGKTTLLNVLSGTIRPTSGHVFLDGERIDRMPAYRVVRAGVAKTHQIPKPFHGMTVRENVTAAATFGAGLREGARVRDEVGRVLRLVELEPRADVPASALTPHSLHVISLPAHKRYVLAHQRIPGGKHRELPQQALARNT